MEALKVGDLCKITKIHPRDGFSGEVDLVGKKARIAGIYAEDEEEFISCELILQENAGEFNEHEEISFLAVKLEKISE